MEVLNITHSKRCDSLKTLIKNCKERFQNRGDLSSAVVEQLSAMVDELSKFSLGQHVMLTGGSNGIWTDYMIAYPWIYRDLASRPLDVNGLEHYIIFEMPTVLAQRELFLYSQKVAQNYVKESSVLCSVPCGMMRDLLTLDFSSTKDFLLLGVDIDSTSLDAAKDLSNKYGISSAKFLQKNAWEFAFDEKIDFINSIGLNVYESDRGRTIDLYKQFYKALKPNGVLFTGVLTYPPWAEEESDWNIQNLSAVSIEMERLLVNEVLELNWQNYRTLDEIEDDFIKAGFDEVEVVPDQYGVFPAVIAKKK